MAKRYYISASRQVIFAYTKLEQKKGIKECTKKNKKQNKNVKPVIKGL